MKTRGHEAKKTKSRLVGFYDMQSHIRRILPSLWTQRAPQPAGGYFMTYFSIFNSNINVQASFLLDRPRRDGKTGKGKNQGRGKEKNMMVEYIPLQGHQDIWIKKPQRVNSIKSGRPS